MYKCVLHFFSLMFQLPNRYEISKVLKIRNTKFCSFLFCALLLNTIHLNQLQPVTPGCGVIKLSFLPLRLPFSCYLLCNKGVVLFTNLKASHLLLIFETEYTCISNTWHRKKPFVKKFVPSNS